ncbi:MAG: hypothetical protein V4492_06345 [Chlamydiota bacterium]
MIITPTISHVTQSVPASQNARCFVNLGARGPLRCDPFGIVVNAVMAIYGLFVADCARRNYERLRESRAGGFGNRDMILAGSNLFKDSVNLAGTIAYLSHWLHETNAITLGRMAGVVQKVSYGSSVVSGVIELAIAFHDIYVNKQKMDAVQDPQEKRLPSQIVNWSLMKVASNVSFVTASVLSVAGLSAVSSPLNAAVMPILGVGCLFFAASVQYRTTFKVEGEK